jgi:TRAP-type transport system periplasmic protein
MRLNILAGALATIGAFASLPAVAETLVFGPGHQAKTPINELIFARWANDVNASSNGAVEIVMNNNPALVNTFNAPDRVADDVVQIGFTMMIFHPGRFPRSLVASVPFIDGTTEATGLAFCNMYKDGVLGSEYDDYQPLFFVPFAQTNLHLNGAPLKTMQDLKGKKIMTGSPAVSAVLAAFGATPISIQLPDQYQALQRGTADGTGMNYTAFPAFKLNEVTTDHLSMPLGGAVGMAFMSKARYEGLNDEARAALEAHTSCDESRRIGLDAMTWEANSKAFVAAHGDHTFSDLPEADVAAIRERAFPGIAAGFAKRVPEGEMVLNSWIEAVHSATEEIGK